MDEKLISKSEEAMWDLLETSLIVNGMCCSNEVSTVRSCLMRLPGVEKVEVNLPLRLAYVNHNPKVTAPAQLASALNQAGIEARVKLEVLDEGAQTYFELPKWHITLGFLCWAISFLCHIPWEPLSYLVYLNYAAIALIGPGIAYRAYKSLFNWPPRLDINCLMLLAGIGAERIGDLSEGATVVVLFGLSSWLEHIATSSVRKAIKAIVDLKPDIGIRSDTKESIPANDIPIGMLLDLGPGNRVPVDGVLTKGSVMVDTSMLTGESVPDRVCEGEKVSGGTLIVDGSAQMEATRVAGESAVAKLVSLVEKAQASRAPIEKTINSIAHWYTPAVVIVAVGLVIFNYSRNPHGNQNESINQALVLLVTACPCALLISTPVTYVCAMAAAAKSLVLVKGGEHLETIAVMKNMALDKTGTLTKAAFSVSSFSIPNISDRLKVLRSVLAVESVSTHPIATALSLYIETQLPPEGKESKDISDFKIVPGKGVESTFEGSRIFIGNNKEKLLDFINSADSGDPWMKAHTELNQWAQDGKTTGVVWINDFPKAYYAVSDIPRTGAKYTVEGLWTLGVQTRMLTGDAKGPARVVGRQIGMNDDMIMSQLLPEDKIRLIRAIKNNALKDIQDNWRLCAPCSGPRKAKLAMVGDGVNDAPAMAAADVAIAMGANGAALAMETADVVLMDSEILKLVWLVKLSRAARRTIIGNITFSIAVKLMVLTLVAFQRADLWMAIFADVGSMLAVTINSTLLLTWESSAPKEKQKRAGRRGEDNKAYGSYGSFDSRKVGGPGTCERGFRDNGENGLELRGFQYSGNESNLEPDLELQGFQYGFSNGSPSNKSDEKELTFDNLVDDLFA